MLMAIDLAKLACVPRNTHYIKVAKPRASRAGAVKVVEIDPEVANNDDEDPDTIKKSVQKGVHSLNIEKWRTVTSRKIICLGWYSPSNSRVHAWMLRTSALSIRFCNRIMTVTSYCVGTY
ncbi:hypothetical protein BHYA_0103g00130 [Botrytis hyacinthi]|uniref:Uncharacterized protein n=1 Tax=Botrytis hyacinthi TaxID=278943 RepID=A0A4Z1GP00_9HELO|nr:hypothetical protein BHYA_0103g00130 [Botrytis hyacinthi]